MADGVIKTARRLFEVLEYFDRVQQPMSLRDISRHFGYPISSAAALLKSMVAMGYLNYDKCTRTYVPTMRIAMLGNWVQDALFGQSRILALMTRLNEVCRETINVGIQSDLVAQYLHVIPSCREGASPGTVGRHAVAPGVVRPLAKSGVGWLLLSAHSDETIERLVRRMNVRLRDRGERIVLPDLMDEIRAIRQQGYVFSRHTVTRGAGMIGAVLPVQQHGRVLTIGIAGPVERLEGKKKLILREMRRGFEELTSAAA
ncbi:MAG: helix-turn-helix domain-containing protein [Rhodospirillales bacterium]|nr:helix-turn-helix domain-containing protein [Rhodospirillales bacterium]